MASLPFLSMVAGILLHFSTKVHLSFHSGNKMYCCSTVAKTSSKSSRVRMWLPTIASGEQKGEMIFYGGLLRKKKKKKHNAFCNAMISILWAFTTAFSWAAFSSFSVMFSALLKLFSVTFQAQHPQIFPNIS